MFWRRGFRIYAFMKLLGEKNHFGFIWFVITINSDSINGASIDIALSTGSTCGVVCGVTCGVVL
jgi:hypothetical protein